MEGEERIKDGSREVKVSGFKEKRSVCQCSRGSRGVNRVFNRDERWRKRREWWKQSGRKSINPPKNKLGRVFKSTTVRETHKREKDVGGKTLHRERRQM